MPLMLMFCFAAAKVFRMYYRPVSSPYLMLSRSSQTYLLNQFLNLLPQFILASWCCAWREVQVDFLTRSSFNVAL